MQSDQCVLCKHYRMSGECEAFPDGIPFDIMSGAFDHTQPHEGDHGVRFEALGIENNATAG